MSKNKLKFRQIHLDFHTSEDIGGIGKDFKTEQFQEMLKLGHVNSITVFSKCHHGWAYHPSTANEIHPYLNFDLLKVQIEAAHEIGVKTPVYISAGLDEKMARRHPEWLMRDEHEATNWVPDFMTPGFHQFCFNTPYLDYLLEQIKEVVINYDADEIFLDIVGVRQCYCQTCVGQIRSIGLDPRNLDDMQKMWEETYSKYTSKVKVVVEKYKPGTPIFHNSGHVRRGRRDLARMSSHLELESLPTGGWGYQHFPLSARYVQGLDMEYLGMTGKFHNTWGEFGGYKHPNALRYETMLNIANGAKCSIGDQLHPEGLMDYSTYSLIGEAYSEVEKKEKWCDDVKSVADVALLSAEAALEREMRENSYDSGCVKMLLEGKYLYDVIDLEYDFDKYKVIILPDIIRINSELKAKLDKFLDAGGKLLATGLSGLSETEERFEFDFGTRYVGESEYNPAYFKPNFKLKSLKTSSFVMYGAGQNVLLASGNELGEFRNPYFNRDVFAFCSHQHTPCDNKRYSTGMAQGSAGIYFSWNAFEQYDKCGSLVYKEIINHALDLLLAEDKTLKIDLPAQGVVTLMYQPEQNRFVQHTLYASPIKRGQFGGKSIEVIEDIVPIYNTKVELKLNRRINKVYLAPQMEEIEFVQNDGVISYTISKIDCHQMVVLE